MKSSLSKCALALMAVILCLAAMTPAALAEADDLTVQIGAQITLEGTLPDTPEQYQLRMTPAAQTNPMPGGQLGGAYVMTMTGAGSAAFPDMTFDRVGVYTYTIEQLPGSYPDCRYDARSYQLTVSVVNGADGGLDVEVALREDGKPEKTNTALFHNVYKTIVPTPAPTTEPGEITQTGVSDMWMYYMAGAAALLVCAGALARRLLRREDGGHEGG